MTHPIWHDWVRHKAPDGDDPRGYSFFWIGLWKGSTDDGRPAQVPCVYNEEDLARNTPYEFELMKDALKQQGLESYYDLCRQMESPEWEEPTYDRFEADDE